MRTFKRVASLLMRASIVLACSSPLHTVPSFVHPYPSTSRRSKPFSSYIFWRWHPTFLDPSIREIGDLAPNGPIPSLSLPVDPSTSNSDLCRHPHLLTAECADCLDKCISLWVSDFDRTVLTVELHLCHFLQRLPPIQCNQTTISVLYVVRAYQVNGKLKKFRCRSQNLLHPMQVLWAFLNSDHPI